MNDCTLPLRSPKPSTLQFIRTFARLYAPQLTSVEEARRLTQLAALGAKPTC